MFEMRDNFVLLDRKKMRHVGMAKVPCSDPHRVNHGGLYVPVRNCDFRRAHVDKQRRRNVRGQPKSCTRSTKSKSNLRRKSVRGRATRNSSTRNQQSVVGPSLEMDTCAHFASVEARLYVPPQLRARKRHQSKKFSEGSRKGSSSKNSVQGCSRKFKKHAKVKKDAKAVSNNASRQDFTRDFSVGTENRAVPPTRTKRVFRFVPDPTCDTRSASASTALRGKMFKTLSHFSSLVDEQFSNLKDAHYTLDESKINQVLYHQLNTKFDNILNRMKQEDKAIKKCREKVLQLKRKIEAERLRQNYGFPGWKGSLKGLDDALKLAMVVCLLIPELFVWREQCCLET